ncbi:MAG TPA: voltage-gated chloride channel family protein [Bacteroidia bacterium]|jgi:H+/Cl- antiporter ClcA|nr:voltage-gated chloride channel family protein [Bacteroidia bacterium]
MSISFSFTEKENQPSFMYFMRWLLVCICIGLAAGIASAVFLASLDWVTQFRESHVMIIAFLPVAGLLIGMLYYYYGNSVVRGNHLLFEEIHYPQKTLPFIMAPFIYLTTVVTHLFGGSAGREGTAVQMGGSMADQFARLLKFNTSDRKLILIAGIAAGFSAVFGTPLAGIVFGWEVVDIGKSKNKSFIPSAIAAIIADLTCKQCAIQHTPYNIPFVPDFNWQGILWAVFAGIAFGVVARFFVWSSHKLTALFSKTITYPPLRPFIGGIILVICIWNLHTTKYIGLGIPTIVNSFQESHIEFDFAIKLMLTVLTLSSGFKGGEVTPLFFIGATLGNALAAFIFLPTGLLAGMGFVAVFAAASNAPIACIIMGMELFGSDCGGYLAIACLFAFFVCGKNSIYNFRMK